MLTNVPWRGASRLTSTVALLSCAFLAACRADAPTGTAQDPRPVPITISAVLTPEQQALIAGMAVEVTRPGMVESIVAELEVSGAAVNGTVTVPVGGPWLFIVRAYDATGAETYVGSATATVRPGSNPALAVTLLGRSAGVPVTVTVGRYTFLFHVVTGATLAPGGGLWIPQGSAATFTLVVRDELDEVVTDGVVRWAVLNPVAFRVAASADGRVAHVTALLEGASLVGTSFNGMIASTRVVTRLPGQ